MLIRLFLRTGCGRKRESGYVRAAGTHRIRIAAANRPKRVEALTGPHHERSR